MNAKAARLTARAVTTLVLVAVAVVTLVPLVYAVFDSFKPLDEILTAGSQLLPRTWTVDNYVEVWNSGNFPQYFLNSTIVVAGVVFGDLVISSFLGYLLARKMVPFQRVIVAVMAGTLFIGVGTATLYPRYLIAQAIGLDNLAGVVLVELSSLTAIDCFLVRAFVESLPAELEDAARVDGNGLVGSFSRVVLPLMRPIIMTIAVLSFQAGWNNFQIPYVFTLAEPAMRTLVVGVYALRSDGGSLQPYNLTLAGAVIVIVPVIILFFFLQRYFVKGMTEGGVKG